MARCPAHDDKTPSLSIREASDGTPLFKCFGGCSRGEVMQALRERGLWGRSARGNGYGSRDQSTTNGQNRAVPKNSTPKDNGWKPVTPIPVDAPPFNFIHYKFGKPAAKWEYRDETGGLWFVKVRWDLDRSKFGKSKTYSQASYCKHVSGQMKWDWKMPTPHPLYRADVLVKYPDKPIIICEGEKSADAAQQFFTDEICVTSGGVASAHCVSWSPVIGRRVGIWPDNDDPGRNYAQKVARLCHDAGAASIAIFELQAEKPERWDAADALAEGISRESLRSILKDVPYSPPPETPEPGKTPEKGRSDGKQTRGEVGRTIPTKKKEAFKPKPEGGVLQISTPDEFLNEMNRNHAFVLLGGKAAILIEPEYFQDGIRFSTRHDLAQQFINRKVRVSGEKGDRLVNAFEFWFSHPQRRQYDRIDFLPRKLTPDRVYNLWRGFAVDPKPGDTEPYMELVDRTLNQAGPTIGNYLLDWMAHAVQRPWEKPGTAIALPGKQGTGKGSLVLPFGRIFGGHFLHVDSPDRMTGRFNMHLAHAVVVFADEAFFAGDHRTTGILKARITEPVLSFEAKGRDAIQLPNYNRIIAASNERWMVPAGMDERRWAVFPMGDALKGNKEFFKRFYRWMDNGGSAHLLDLLLSRDIRNFDARDYPRTEALGENVIASMEPITRWWFEALSEGEVDDGEGWPERVSCSRLLDRLAEFCRRHPRQVAVTPHAMGRTLSDLCGLISRARWDKDAGKTRKMYELPPLDECRARFEHSTGFKCDWPRTEPEH